MIQTPNPAAPLRIGVDFDNTIVRYDDLFERLALEMRVIDAPVGGGKTALRDHIRTLEGGNWQWTMMQARAYGPDMHHARAFEGVRAFFDGCRRAGIPVAIISHKTEFAAADASVNLRDAARAWLDANGFTGQPGAPPVFFESTLREKLARIGSFGCTHFIDDLEEVFIEPDFPAGVERWLFVPDAAHMPQGPFRRFRSWAEIADTALGQWTR